MNNGEKKVKGKILTGSDMRYEVFDAPLWSNVNMEGDSVLPIALDTEKEFITFALDGPEIKMSIHNKTPFDLETAYIQWGNGYYYLGDLEAESTIDVSIKMSEVQQDFTASPTV